MWNKVEIGQVNICPGRSQGLSILHQKWTDVDHWPNNLLNSRIGLGFTEILFNGSHMIWSPWVWTKKRVKGNGIVCTSYSHRSEGRCDRSIIMSRIYLGVNIVALEWEELVSLNSLSLCPKSSLIVYGMMRGLVNLLRRSSREFRNDVSIPFTTITNK